MTSNCNKQTGLRALASEIAFNLREIDAFVSHKYKIESDQITAEGTPTTLRYITCMTKQFESTENQQSLMNVSGKLRDEVFQVYQGFREINTRAEALRQAFRSLRASQYLEAVDEFLTRHRNIAEDLVRTL